MAGTTIGVGAALVLLGVVGYVGSGAASVTALIPAVFGALLVAAGLVARREDLRRHAMHAAALVGVLGFLGSAGGLVGLVRWLAGGEVARPAAVVAQSVMAVLLAGFVALCVKSFIDARRRRARAG